MRPGRPGQTFPPPTISRPARDSEDRLTSAMRRARSILLRFRKHLLKGAGVGLIYLLPILAIPATGALYLKIEDIKGSSTDQDHVNWVDAQSFGFGVTRQI